MVGYSSKNLVVIAGPTAVGKTSVAIRLAKLLDCEIISADSRQVFKEMEIGTAKPSPSELNEAQHHFVNHVSIHEPYDAAKFGEEAFSKVLELLSVKDFVIVCGGSGLYIKGLLEGFDEIPEIPKEIREQLVASYEQNGIAWLQDKMQELDPEYLAKIDKQNPQRLIRALEVVVGTGRSISEYHGKNRRQLPFHVIRIGLELEREVLYERIDKRVDVMISSGLFEEAATLYPLRDNNALNTVGYQEVFGYFDGSYDREEAIRLLKRNTRRYAKRQLTWFKADTEMKWFSPEDFNDIVAFIRENANTNR